MNRYGIIGLLLWVFFPLVASAQIPDSIAGPLTALACRVEQFGKALPQEKVALHLDNTSYYQGDDIWFQCYVVASGLNRPTEWSKTLYVELLNPGGEIVSKQILPVRNGRCHGHFALTQLPFYSGFYEVRAYTKYMLNFDEASVFSRIIPVFDKPEVPGNYVEKEISPRAGKYPQERKRPRKEKKLNLRFYPEGGYLVKDVPVRVAFEATDAYGNPVDVSGRVVDKEGRECLTFAAGHEGKGSFTYTAGEEEGRAEVIWNEKRYRFDLPEAREQGFACSVDNLSSPDSLLVTVQKNARTPGCVLGMAVIGGGQLYHFSMLTVTRSRPVRFGLDKRNLPVGVVQVVWFDPSGRLVADRLIFVGQPDTLSVAVRSDKAAYQPYDSIRLDVEVRDTEGRPVQAPLSVSVRDGWQEVENRHSLLTDLLLMSDIKGYVHRPAWYFESGDLAHRRALDELLMVQGWRRYDWESMAGVRPFDLKYLPEQGIELHGTVVSMVRSKPRAGVEVSSFLSSPGEDPETGRQQSFGLFTTDSLGRFSFVSQIEGKWNLILAVTKEGKKKDHRIVLDRVFAPAPRMYPLAEMQVRVPGGEQKVAPSSDEQADTVQVEEDYNLFLQAYEDSLRRLGIDEKIHHLDEVEVKARKRDKASDVYQARTKSIAYYDVASEMDDIQDRNGFVGDDIHELMRNMNPDFYTQFSPSGEEYLFYKGRLALFVINYERTRHEEMDFNKYRSLTLESIKSIYISEDLGTMCRYADPRFTPMNIDKLYGCVVLIETKPEGEIPAKGAKGVRKTWLEGYSKVKEFYSPDYRVLPREEDYRRTLYWQPELMTDEQGRATVRFFNNSRCRRPRVTVNVLDSDGRIGSLEQ